MIHKRTLENYPGDFKQLATELGDLTYDALALFLQELREKLNQDGDADFNRGRVQLAKNLHQAAANLADASASVDKAWKICEPFMT